MKRTEISRKPRRRKCAQCREWFQPMQMGQTACSVPCAIMQSKMDVLRRVHTTPRRTGNPKTDRRTALKRCQVAFNAYIRARDAHLGCVSCHLPADWDGQWHASHYRSVGAAPELRFDPLNCHKACSVCNAWKSGNLDRYRPKLIVRIGLENVEWLEGPHEPVRLHIDTISAMAARFRKMTRDLKKSIVLEA